MKLLPLLRSMCRGSPTASTSCETPSVRREHRQASYFFGAATERWEGPPVPIGYWTTVKFSGALPARRVNELLDRVEKLQQAVKFAPEEANGTEVTDRRVGDAVFGYLFS